MLGHSMIQEVFGVWVGWVGDEWWGGGIKRDWN